MTVQEIFKKADSEAIFYAYMLVRPEFDDLSIETRSERVEHLKKLRKYVEEERKRIATCEVNDTEESKTVFVIGRTRLEWKESYIQDLECFYTIDRDARMAVKKNFTMWDDEGDMRLNFYAIDLASISDFAGWNIAEKSVREQGIEVCCAMILQDIFFYGYTEEQREKSWKLIEEKLERSKDDIKNNKVHPMDELMRKLDDKLYKNATEDEKEHYRLECEYEEKVKDIEYRKMVSILEKDHQRYIAAVREEYTRS